MAIGNNALDAWRSKYVNPVTGGAESSAGSAGLSGGGSALDSWREKYVAPVTTPKQTVPVTPDPVVIPPVPENNTPSVAEADGGGSGNFFTKMLDLFTASQNMQKASEMSIYGGKKVDAIADQLDTKAEQMIIPAKPEVGYVGERGAVGAAQSTEGIINALGYMGQALNRTQNLQASQDAAMWGAVTGSKTQKALSERLEQTALDSAREGLKDTVSFGDEYDEKVERKYAGADISDLGRGAAVVSEGIGGMLPNIAMAAIAPGTALSSVGMFLSSMGNATQEAKKEGYNDLKAMAYGSAVGAVEVATEKMFDGLSGVFGKGAFDDVVKNTIRKTFKSEAAQKAVNYLVNAAGEGVEEFVSELGTRIANELTINNDDRTVWQTFRDGGKSFLVGSLISGIMQAGGNVTQLIRTDPAAAAQQVADSVIAEVKSGTEQVKTQQQEANSGFIPGSGLDGTPAAMDGMIPVQDRGSAQTTPSAAEQTAPAPGVNTYGQFGAVEGEKAAPTNAETAKYTPEEVSKIRYEGNSFKNIIAGIDSTVTDFFNKWRYGRKSHLGEKLEKLYLGKMSDRVKKEVSSILGYEVSERDFIVTNDDVKHIMDEHGNAEAEIKKGNLPLEQWVFEAIPDVVTSPDAVTEGHEGTGKNNGKTGVKFEKTLPDGKVVCVQFDNKGRGTMEITTVYAKESTPSMVSAPQGANTRTPEAMESVVLSNTNVPQVAPGVKNQYTQESAQAFIPGRGTENATVEDGVPVQSDNGSTDEGYWDSIMEEQALPFSESDVNGYMEALLADVDQRLNRATRKETPVTEEYEPAKKGKKPKRDDKSPTEHEQVKEIMLDPEVAGSKSITTEFAQALSSSGISYNKDLARNLDAAGAGSAKLREGLRNLIERPFRAAGKSYADNTKSALNDLKKTMDELGIKKGSKESAAVQRYGEGQYQDEKGEVHEYTEAMLREEFPESWQNIVKAAQYCRQLYDGYVDRINATLEQIYPNALGKAVEEEEYQNSKAGLFSQMAEEQQRTYNSLQERLNERKRQLEKSREGTQRHADLQNTIHRIEWQMENVQGKISSLRNQVDVSNAKAAAIHARIVSGEVLRNKQLPKRSDYFHHFNEMAEGWAGLANILTTPSDIDSTLAGTSDHTKPKTRWAGFMQGRKGAAYTEDAVGGLLKYIPQAEYKISFDPIIAENRNIIKTLAEETEDSRNANKFIEWMTDWTNDLAGKTNPFDRAVQKVVGRKAISVAKWLSSRAKANAVVGNVRSATAQVFNLPNAMVYIKSPEAWKNGAKIYGRALGGDQTAKSLFEESGFLSERYMDDAISQFDEGVLKKPEKFANWMLTAGDKEVAKLIWASAYEQGRRNSVADPVEYADDITRRSIAGRGVGDVPLMQKAVVTQLFAPFQVEVNNTWQLMKEAGADKNWVGLLAMFAMSFLMNSVTRELFGYDVGIDPFNAVIEGIQNWDEEKTIGGNVLGITGRLGGELLSNVPYGAQIGSTLISDEYEREKIFGDADPSRFGTGNIGIDAVKDFGVSVWDAVSEGDITKVDLMTPATNFLLPYGGKQVGRIVEGAQDLGLIPVASKEGIARQPDAGSMSDAGRLRFAIDENNPADVAKLFAFGPFSTSTGIEYIEDGMLPLSEKRTAEAMAAAERGVDLVDYMDAYRAQAKVKTTADKLEAAAKFADDEETARELFGIVLGTEMVTEAGNPTQYAKVLAAMDEGMTAAEYVKYRQATYDVSKKADKLKALQAAGFTAAEAARLLEQLG